MTKTINDEKIQNVNGGSWYITEKDGKNAGLELRKENGDPGSWGYLYNEGDYYWKGKKITQGEANCLVHYYNDYHSQPETLEEAVERYG